jgi:hypothetical protein
MDKTRLILRYKKGSKEINGWMSDPLDRRMWDVLSKVPGYTTMPTLSLRMLQEMGLIPKIGGNKTW